MGGELLFLLIFGLILFGPEELPKIARTIGRVAYEIKKASSDVQNEVRRTISLEAEKAKEPVTPAPPEPAQKEFPGEGRS